MADLRGGSTVGGYPIADTRVATSTRSGLFASADKATFDAATASNIGGTLVKRDGNGDFTSRYMFATYFNMSAGVDNGQTLTNIIIDNGDGYLRRMGLSTFQSKLTSINADQLDGIHSTGFVQNGGSTPSITTGADGSKGSAGTASRLYVSTDGNRIYRDTGSTWQIVGTVNWSDLAGKPTTVAASGLTDALANTWTGSANIATVGTITSGTWQGTKISPSYINTDTNNRFVTDTNISNWGTAYTHAGSTHVGTTGANASGTWGISISGNAATATQALATVSGTNSAEIVRGNMADNDFFRILIGGTASNAGYVEIATADDGSEPIYVRQYSGVFTSLTRTATLLDASGNTSFPGSVTAASFSGNISGNISGYKNIDNSNEITVANGFAGGILYLNYRGASSAITELRIANGLSTGSFANLAANVLISNVAQGTAPFTVTSTTQVNNLNAQYVGGKQASDFALSGHNHTYNVNDAWLRENGDDANVKLYGNSRQMVFRTDGTTEYATGVGAYAFAFMYGGDAAANRIVLINSNGDIWSTNLGNWFSAGLGNSLTTSGNNILLKSWGGTTLSTITAPYATNAGNADTLDTIHSSGFVQTTYNSSLNSDSRNSRGVTRLYRIDDNSDYSVQTNWTGSYWKLYGYNGDTAHGGCYVAYTDNSDMIDSMHATGFTLGYVTGNGASTGTACTFSGGITTTTLTNYSGNSGILTLGTSSWNPGSETIAGSFYSTATGSQKFMMFSNNGGMSLYLDGTVYVTDNNYAVIHAGNISSQSVNYANSAGSATNATNASNLNGFTNSNSGNPIANPDNLTNNGIAYTQGISLMGQSDGALYVQAYSSSWASQIYQNYRDGRLAVRGKNSGTWTGWLTVIDSGNIGSQSVNYASSAGNADTLDGNHASAFAPSSTVSFPGFGGNGSAGTASRSDHSHSYLTSESDTLATVTGRGSTTSAAINVGSIATTSGSVQSNTIFYTGKGSNTASFVSNWPWASYFGIGPQGSSNGIRLGICDSAGNWVASDPDIYVGNSNYLVVHSGNAVNYINHNSLAVGGTTVVNTSREAGFTKLTINQSTTTWGGGLLLYNSTIYWNIVQGGDNRLFFGKDGATKMIIDTSGNLLVAGDVTNYTTSDRRLKNNIKFISDPFDKLDKIRGVEFDWDEKAKKLSAKEGHDYGVIAQEVEEVFPEMVRTRDNGYKSVDYEKLIPVLIQSVKELKKELKELKGE